MDFFIFFEDDDCVFTNKDWKTFINVAKKKQKSD